MKLLTLSALLVCALMAQSDSPTSTLSLGDANVAYQNIYDPAGGTSTVYHCKARSIQNVQTLPTISAATNASPAVLTITAHAFDFQTVATTKPIITITGGTGNWAAINGTWTFTPTSANAGSIPVDSTTFGALTGTFVVTTRAPRTTGLYWSIIHTVTDGSGNTVWTGWAADPTRPNTSVGGSPSYSFACASRTLYSYQ